MEVDEQVGESAACARSRAGSVLCWGADTPTIVPGVEHVAGVVVGTHDACAWHDDGTVTCWAFIGKDTAPHKMAGLDHVVEMSAGHTLCARTDRGAVACWTRDMSVPYGNVPPKVFKPVTISDALELVAAGPETCARRANKDVTCWIDDKIMTIAAARGATSLGAGRTETWSSGAPARFAAILPDGHVVGWMHGDTPWQVPALPAGVTRIAMGGQTGCGLAASVHCWDIDLEGHMSAIHEIPSTSGAVDLAIGPDLACVRTRDSQLACWGRIEELGTGLPSEQELPVEVPGIDDGVQLVTNDDETCVRRASGRVACFAGAPPVDLPLTDIVDLGYSSGGNTCAKPKAGSTMCWGYKDGAHVPARPQPIERRGSRSTWSGSEMRFAWVCGREGAAIKCNTTFHGRHGETDEGSDPELDRKLAKLGPIADLAFHRATLVALTRKGVAATVDLVGGDDFREVATGAVALARGPDRSGMHDEDCALLKTGAVHCWETEQPDAARDVPGIADAIAVVNGQWHVCVLRKTGKVACWGSRDRLGTGDGRMTSRPSVVPGLVL